MWGIYQTVYSQRQTFVSCTKCNWIYHSSLIFHVLLWNKNIPSKYSSFSLPTSPAISCSVFSHLRSHCILLVVNDCVGKTLSCSNCYVLSVLLILILQFNSAWRPLLKTGCIIRWIIPLTEFKCSYYCF